MVCHEAMEAIEAAKNKTMIGDESTELDVLGESPK